MMPKILITGHKGFIGSNLLKKAIKLGWHCLTLEYNEYNEKQANCLVFEFPGSRPEAARGQAGGRQRPSQASDTRATDFHATM